jgi:hypothetical protein
MAETIKNKYRYTLADGRGSIVTNPLGENNLKITDQFNEDDDGRAEYRRTIEGDLTFIGEDYIWLWEKETGGGRCDEITILIERKDCYDNWQQYARGYLSMSAGKWNLDNCQVTITADLFYPYQCLDDYLDTEVNMLAEVTDRVTISFLDPTITVEKIKCQPPFVLHNQVNPFYCDMTSNPYCGTGTPASQGWVMYMQYHLMNYARGTANTTCWSWAWYARETIQLPNGNVPNLADGWVNVGAGDAGKTKWARPARLYSKKNIDNYWIAYLGTTTTINGIEDYHIELYKIFGDPTPEDITGKNQDGTLNVVGLGGQTGSGQTLQNGVLLNQFLTKLVTNACPALAVVSNFFGLNVQGVPTTLTYQLGSADVQVLYLGGDVGAYYYQMVFTNVSIPGGFNIRPGQFVQWNLEGLKFFSIQSIVGISANGFTVNIQNALGIETGSYHTDVLNVYNSSYDSNNYVTGKSSYTSSIVLFDQSDVKYPNAQNPATISNITLGDLLKILCGMFNCEWWVDAGVLHIEHVSYREQEIGLQLTPEAYPTITGMRQYSYDRSQLPRRETFTFEIAKNVDFVGAPILYNNGCSSKEKAQQDRKIEVEASTDIQRIMEATDDIPNDGLVVLAAVRAADLTSYYIASEPPILGDQTQPNNVFGWAFLHRDYWMYNRPFRRGVMNNRNTLFRSVRPTKVGANLRIPVCCDVWFNPKQKITTPLGIGTVKQADYNLSDSTLDLQLLYDATTDDALSGRPYANNDVMYAVSGGVYTYWQIVANDQDPVSGINPNSIEIVEQPAVGTVEVVTYNGVPGFIRWRATQNYVGDEVFTYTIANRSGVRSDPGFVIINVLANANPQAIDDYIQVIGNENISVPSPGVLANDTLPNGGTVLNAGTYNTAHGVLNISQNGAYTYTPTTGYVGPDSFIYTVRDQLNNQSSASMFFTVTPPLRIQITVTNLPPAPGNPLYKCRFTFTMVGGGTFPKGWTLRFGACSSAGYCNGFPGATNPNAYMTVSGFVGSTAASVDSTFNMADGQVVNRIVIFELYNINQSQIFRASGQTFTIEYQ